MKDGYDKFTTACREVIGEIIFDVWNSGLDKTTLGWLTNWIDEFNMLPTNTNALEVLAIVQASICDCLKVDDQMITVLLDMIVEEMGQVA